MSETRKFVEVANSCEVYEARTRRYEAITWWQRSEKLWRHPPFKSKVKSEIIPVYVPAYNIRNRAASASSGIAFSHLLPVYRKSIIHLTYG